MHLRLIPAILALAAFVAPARAADDKPAAHVHDSPEMTKCEKACVDCAKECESCFHHCAMMLAQGKKEHLRSLQTCNDCGVLCAVAAKLIARHGPFVGLTCDACGKACDLCGAECEKFTGDEHMKKCATACRDCAKACRDMVKVTGTGVTTITGP